jgi:hypothetical protein
MSLPRVNIAHMVINEHAPIFADLIELLTAALQELSLEVLYTRHGLVKGRLNVLIGHTVFLTPAAFGAIQNSKCSYVVFQTEALDRAQGLVPLCPAYLDFLRSAAQIWDYSECNIRFLAGLGHAGAWHVPVGYSGRLERVVRAEVKDIDVLFYGQPTPRRLHVLQELEGRGFQVRALFGVYGSPRDELIGRSRIVLNMHQFDTSQLEQVRIAYLLNNRCFVVSEAADCNPYGDGVVFAPYADLAECCAAFLRPGREAERERIAAVGYANLMATPMRERLEAALRAMRTAPGGNAS